MTEIKETRRIPASLDAVWSVLDDIDRYAEWGETTVSVTQGVGKAAKGVRYEERNKVVGPITTGSRWTVTEHDPPRRAVHRGEGIMMTRWFEAIFDVAPAGDATDLTLTFRYQPSLGFLGRILDALLFRRMLPAEMKGSLESVGRLAVAEPTPAREAPPVRATA